MKTERQQRNKVSNDRSKSIPNAIDHRLEEMRTLQKNHRLVFKIDGIPYPRELYTYQERVALRTWKRIVQERQDILIATEPKEFAKGPHRRKVV
jgi:hypothetical protein